MAYGILDRVGNFFGVGPEAQQLSQQGMVDPRAIAWGQALGNIAQMNMGGIPSVNPAQAFGQQQQTNALLAMRQQQIAQNQRMRDLQMQRMQAELDPFYAYRMFQRDFPEQAKDVSLQDFQRFGLKSYDPSSSAQKNFLTRQALVEQFGEDSDEVKTFDTYVRAPRGVPLGGGGQAIYGAGGSLETVVSPEEATRREAELRGSMTGAEEDVRTRAGQVREGMQGTSSARDAYLTAENVLRSTNEMLGRFESGEFDTGPVVRFMLNTFGVGPENLGELNAEAIRQGLANLGITNLAPVTEQEFANVMKMWADIASGEEANVGALKSARRRTERLMDRIRNDAIYNAGLVETYGSDAQYNAYLRANPFVADLLSAPESREKRPLSELLDEATQGESP